MPNFAERVEVAVDALGSTPQKEVDENEFIDGSRLVYDGVREIRRAVLMNRVSGTGGLLPSLIALAIAVVLLMTELRDRLSGMMYR